MPHWLGGEQDKYQDTKKYKQIRQKLNLSLFELNTSKWFLGEDWWYLYSVKRLLEETKKKNYIF